MPRPGKGLGPGKACSVVCRRATCIASPNKESETCVGGEGVTKNRYPEAPLAKASLIYWRQKDGPQSVSF